MSSDEKVGSLCSLCDQVSEQKILSIAENIRELAMFNMVIDCKRRSCEKEQSQGLVR